MRNSKLSNEIGKWEIHTKGVGSKILKKFNWKIGQSLGKNPAGILIPLMKIDGQFDGQTYPIFKEIKSVRDFKKVKLINEIDKLLKDSAESEDEEMQMPTISPRLEYFYFADLLIRDLSDLTLHSADRNSQMQPTLVEVGQKDEMYGWPSTQSRVLRQYNEKR